MAGRPKHHVSMAPLTGSLAIVAVASYLGSEYPVPARRDNIASRVASFDKLISGYTGSTVLSSSKKRPSSSI